MNHLMEIDYSIPVLVKLPIHLQSVMGQPEERNVTIQGYISRPLFGYGKSSSDRQFYFINSRPITLQRLSKTVNEVYKSFNPVQYPFVVLNVLLDTNYYDVNVSPDKRSVLIHNEGEMLEAISSSLVAIFAESMKQAPQSVNRPSTSSSVSTDLSADSSSFSTSSASVHMNSSHKSSNPEVVLNTIDLNVQVIKPTGEKRRHRVDMNEPEGEWQEQEQDEQVPEDNTEEVNEQEREAEQEQEQIEQRSQTTESGYVITEILDTSNDLFSDQLDVADTTESPNDEVDEETEHPRESVDSIDSRNVQAQKEPVVEVDSNSLDSGTQINDKNSEPQERAASIENNVESQNSEDMEESEEQELEDQEVHKQAPTHTEREKRVPKEVPLFDSRPAKVRKSSQVPLTNNSGPILDSKIKGLKGFESAFGVFQKLDVDIGKIKEGYERIVTLTEEDPQHGMEVTKTDIADEAAEGELTLKLSLPEFSQMEIVGQFNLGFILTLRRRKDEKNREIKDLFIVDQHASDEKYNFEDLAAKTKIHSQPLVVPKELHLTPIEELVVADVGHILEANGFVIQYDETLEPGKRCRLLRRPVSKETVFDDKDLEEILSLAWENPGMMVRCSKVRSMLAMRACRSSIMIGKPLDMSTMKQVVSNLGTLKRPWNCPHGRPTLRHLAVLSKLTSWSEDLRN
ncbi:hypothetical protein CANCADRAFT_30112 [Tortispora caseinolytica NRRL Y-17796]|uniref:MutL C-terminal dimerisation domain-containing protein n=1 Tax=Tortispora caseinolytica NRRL Y-17796 TaxID=767744 RepID=A0A1E4TJ67_9ASCO|nr:hypothetical protein CANCADRAFT_30112 [Tortispora caseinolytica NRRL Y-17796]